MVDKNEGIEGLGGLYDAAMENPSAAKALNQKPFDMTESLRKVITETEHHVSMHGDQSGMIGEGLEQLRSLQLVPDLPVDEPIDWYKPTAADLARRVVQKDRSGIEQNYGNLVLITVGGITCLMDELYALSLGWDYQIKQEIATFSKEYALCFCPDIKMKWVDHHGTPVFAPAPDGDIFIAVETFIFLFDEKDMFQVVKTLREPNPLYKSVWVGARRLI